MYRQDVLASNIKKYRIRTGLTQAELADRLFISTQAISKWERGQSLPEIENLCSLAEIFEISIDKLLGVSKQNPHRKNFIGIDGGGTKTEFVLFSEEGHILTRIVLEGSNPNVCGMKKTLSVLKLGIDTVLAINSDVSGVFCGIAGYTTAENAKAINEFFKKIYPFVNASANSDIVNVMNLVPELEKSIAAICGTGFSVFTTDGENIFRVGGWGYLLDKGGSGFDIGRDAISASLAFRDGFGEHTLLCELVEKQLGGEIWNKIDKIYSGGASFVASFAPLVFEACEKGDEKALEILNNNAKRVATMINTAQKMYNCSKVAIMSGGLFKNKIFFDAINKFMAKDIKLIVPNLPPIYGACVKCCKLYGTFSNSFTEKFCLDYSKL